MRAGAASLDAVVPRQATNDTATNETVMTQTAICRGAFIAAEYDSAAMNATLRDLPREACLRRLA